MYALKSLISQAMSNTILIKSLRTSPNSVFGKEFNCSVLHHIISDETICEKITRLNILINQFYILCYANLLWHNTLISVVRTPS